MNITSLKQLCNKLDITPRKSKGQNFLLNKKVVQKMIETSGISKKDTVIEVGPGFGILTEELRKKAKKVIAVELDRKFYNYLLDQFANKKNVELVNQDILKFDLDKLGLGQYKVVANLPYQITSAVIRFFLTAKNKPSEMTVMVQKEVAQRMVACPPKMNLLALSVQYYGQPEIKLVVDKNNFWPKPKVDSAVVVISKIDEISQQHIRQINEQEFFHIVKIGFQSKRKQLINNLSRKMPVDKEELAKILKELSLSTSIRPQNMSLSNWFSLIKILY